MRKAAIIGAGKSGLAAERILKLDGYDVIDYYDDRKASALPVCEYKDGYDITVVSPGINPKLLKVIPANRSSELELAYKELPMGSKVLGVTGTNGKSTVTHIAAQIINNMGYSAIAVGNIGYPFADAVLDKPSDVYVVELSSFQIELLRKGKFELNGAAFTNITPDHLDRYDSYNSYIAAKIEIINFISPDGMLATLPDQHLINKLLKKHYKINYIDNGLIAYPKLKDNNILNFGEFWLNLNEFKLFGKHNVLNLVFALSLATMVAPLEGDITHLIANLTGLAHRTETVLVKNGVTWINDSKATNVDSTLIALQSCERPIVLLLGGRDKMGDFTQLVTEINRVGVLIVAFGEAKEIIYNQLYGKLDIPMVKANKLREAMEISAKTASNGCTVILSPGCASYDEFKNFEERGIQFAKYAKEITNA